jgi:hypothetical protein
MEANIINLFSFTIRDIIFEQGEIFVQDHPNYIFEELEQTFCKRFRIVKNNEEIYMQLKKCKNKLPNMLRFIMNAY